MSIDDRALEVASWRNAKSRSPLKYYPNVNHPYFRIWHELTVRGAAQVRLLPVKELTCQPDHYDGEF